MRLIEATETSPILILISLSLVNLLDLSKEKSLSLPRRRRPPKNHWALVSLASTDGGQDVSSRR
jgi:hypothetical protein